MNRTIATITLLGLWVFLGCGSCLSAEEASSEPIRLLNADFSELRLEEDNVMINLVGNVIFQHGDLNLRSSRAVWYKTAGQVVFIDSVRIEDPDQVLTADQQATLKEKQAE